MNAIPAASSRVLSGTITAPVIGIPKCASIISGVFASSNATVSPRRCLAPRAPRPAGGSAPGSGST